MFLLFSLSVLSQEKCYKFSTIDMRTSTGWEIKDIPGFVVFYKDENTDTISIVTENRYYTMYVKSKLLFVRQYNYLYTLVDDNGSESSIRLIFENKSDEYIQFYIYSNRPGEKYFRLCLEKCKK
jgi:hypothetical protein